MVELDSNQYLRRGFLLSLGFWVASVLVSFAPSPVSVSWVAAVAAAAGVQMQMVRESARRSARRLELHRDLMRLYAWLRDVDDTDVWSSHAEGAVRAVAAAHVTGAPCQDPDLLMLSASSRDSSGLFIRSSPKMWNEGAKVLPTSLAAAVTLTEAAELVTSPNAWPLASLAGTPATEKWKWESSWVTVLAVCEFWGELLADNSARQMLVALAPTWSGSGVELRETVAELASVPLSS